MLSKLIGVARVVTCVDGPRRLKYSRDITAGGLVFRTPFLFGGAALEGVMILWQPTLHRCPADADISVQLLGKNIFFLNLMNFGASIPLTVILTHHHVIKQGF